MELPLQRKNWAKELPDEILLSILEKALSLPKGIHFERWQMLKMILIDPLLLPGLSHLVPSAFYKINDVSTRFVPAESTSIICTKGHKICYPRPEVNQWVRNLTLEVNLIEQTFLRYQDSHSSQTFQLEWLQALASGSVGFKKLDQLALDFDWLNPGASRKSRYCTVDLGYFRDRVRQAGILQFAVGTLVIKVAKHSCGIDDCQEAQRLVSDDICLWVAQLQTLFVKASP
ncbi:hypothetical protein P280DRAFT_485222 [Massarina eburnea CBS 473.64]|uniref:F-box domain-containing protein n=1 Tax=Massarina eburnea CBS 473.64 TaxID=1395130 RepID=A0A6A6RGU9_9PLEO|nr:hypothetical protein P280DRAFT_485222 [Massarina eburnea CBS 473.64]